MDITIITIAFPQSQHLLLVLSCFVNKILLLRDFVYKNMDQGQLTGSVFLDLKKAFDTVDAETLLFKLKCLNKYGS